MTACERVRKELLDAPLRVTLSDGRVIIGSFSCFDKQQNVLLTEAREQRFSPAAQETAGKIGPPEFERNLGLVLVPWKYITSCHALEIT